MEDDQGTISWLSSRLQCRSSIKSKPGWLNKGAILVLVYGFSGLMVFNYIVSCSYCYEGRKQYYNIGATIVITVFYPIAGLLADVRFGRYQFIRVSQSILWVAMVLSVLNVCVYELGYSTYTIMITLHSVKYLVVAVALGGFQANIVQFGIDQLFDASSVQIMKFISWYVWLYFFCNVVLQIVQGCLCKGSKSLVEIVVLLSVSIGVVSDFFFRSHLIVEPATSNPLKQIYKVLLYVKRNKYPLLRSAFTYWEDKPYSRMDLAKLKFGGPFTTEQVEDVKTFFRMIIVIFCFSFMVSSVFLLIAITLKGMYNFRDKDYESSCSFTAHYWWHCSRRMLVNLSGYLVVTFGVPLYQLVLNPCCTRVAFFCTIAKKMVAGIVAVLVCNVILLVLEVSGYLYTKQAVSSDQIKAIPCLLLATSKDLELGRTLQMSFAWLVIPNVIDGVALYMVAKAAMEFLCAQSPYSMKGLLIGVSYATVGLSIFFVSLMDLPFKQLFKHTKSNVGCATWFVLASLCVCGVSLLVICCIIKWYSRRRRDENIHNEQIFAVNYYDCYTQFNNRDSEQEGDDLSNNS